RAAGEHRARLRRRDRRLGAARGRVDPRNDARRACGPRRRGDRARVGRAGEADGDLGFQGGCGGHDRTSNPEVRAPVTTEAEVRAAFAELLPRRTSAAPPPILGLGLEDFSAARDYLARAAEGGWVVPRWPEEYGGRGASEDEAELISRVQQEFEVP